jgi:hypothetical protein
MRLLKKKNLAAEPPVFVLQNSVMATFPGITPTFAPET